MQHLESIAKSGPLSSGTQRSVKKPLPPGPDGGEGSLPGGELVNSCISQTALPDAFLLYPSAVKIVRKRYGQRTDKAPPVRTDIQGFSDHSRRRLRFLAGNTCTRLISQFCPTYHNSNPDGSTVKKHLNAWLTLLRKKYPGVHYLWVLEFQTRGVPHFHVWLSLPHDLPGLHEHLARSWNQIAEPGDLEHLRFHLHRKNFIAWDMYSTSYLTKYLDKESQKAIPPGFTGCGRFWGNSRGLLAIPETITPHDLEHLDCETMSEAGNASPAAYILRTLGKLHERKIRRSRWKSRARTAMTSYTLQTAAPAFRTLRDYLQRSYEKNNNTPF